MLVDGVGPLQRQSDVVMTAQQPVAQVLVDDELHLASRRQGHDTAFQIDGRDGRRRLYELAHVCLGQLDSEQPVLAAIRAEDVGERGGDDGPETAPAERPGSVLARGAAPEVGTSDEDGRALELRAVEREIVVLRPVPEEELTVARALDPLEELLRDDLVGVDVVAIERGDRPGDHVEMLHQTSSLTSTREPATAAAAAISGLIRCVRASRPWRPSKLRLEVEATRSFGPAMSGFIPRHIEHPALRHSKPASANTRSRPSASASALTRIDPGTTSACT